MAPSVTQLIIILAIVVLIFGAKRLRTIGSDMGAAVKGFKDAVKTEGDKEDPKNLAQKADESIDTQTTTAARESHGESVVSPQASPQADAKNNG